MRAQVRLGLVVALILGRPVPAAGGDHSTISIAIVGGREIAVPVHQPVGPMPMVDVRRLAPELDMAVEDRGDRVVIRDSAGGEWSLGNGSMLLEGPMTSRPLANPAVISGRAIYLSLDCVADLARRTLVLEGSRALLLLPSAGAPSDVRTPAGWNRLTIPKTPEELAETRRLEGDPSTELDRPVVKEVQPPAHEALTFDVGLGLAQGLSGATDVVASGSVAGVLTAFNTFLTYGHEGVVYRSGRLTLQDSAATWSLEAGDLLSDVRGLARGVRVGKAIGSVWRPSIGLYAHSDALSPTDGGVLAYRDELQLPADIGLRTEALSDGSAFVGARWFRARTSLDIFYRYGSSRRVHDRGATVSYDVWHGITAQVGARLSTGAGTDRWYLAALSVPIANHAIVTLERTRSSLNAGDTSALGLQLPIGRIRVMQRYQWTDIAFVPEPTLTQPGYRQLQSLASYSPTPRIQLSYQLATQWSVNTLARQWTELQVAVTLSRATSFHAVAGLPDAGHPQRFRFGLQQNLRRGFRLTVEYGHLPAFQSPREAETWKDAPRLLVMVRRSFTRRTPAGGSDVRGRVVDQRGNPVAGAVVTLGSYVTTAGRDGSYRFSHVPSGEFDLALDRSRLPAQYASDGVQQRLRLTGSADSQVDLRAVPLYAIHGHVYIDRNGSGAFDPGEGVPQVVIGLSGGGPPTMTDDDGAYGFYNLRPGQYEVGVDSDRLNRDLNVVSSSAVTVSLDEGGQPRTGVDFRLAPRQKPIVLQKDLK